MVIVLSRLLLYLLAHVSEDIWVEVPRHLISGKASSTDFEARPQASVHSTPPPQAVCYAGNGRLDNSLYMQSDG